MSRILLLISFLLSAPALAQTSKYYPSDNATVGRLTINDLANRFGGSPFCIITYYGSTIFYDNGEAIVRFHGRLLEMKAHKSVPSARYEAKDEKAAMEMYMERRQDDKRYALDEIPINVIFVSREYGRELVPAMLKCR